MDRGKKPVLRALNGAEAFLTGKTTALWVLVAVMVLVYGTLFELSLGLEFLVVGFVLMAAHLRKEPQMKYVLPTFALSGIALALLLFSGKLGQTDFNSPIHHALKFVDLFLAHVMVVLMIRMDQGGKRKVLFAVGGIEVIAILISLFCVLFLDAYAIRYFEDGGFYQVLDFNQMYAVPFVVTVLACWLMAKGEKKISTLVYLVFLGLALLCVVLSLYTTALLLAVMGLALAFLFSQYYRSPKRFWIIIGVIAFAVVLCFLFRQQVSDLVYRVTEPLNWLVRARIRSVADMILGTSGDNWYTPDRRNELAGYSITTFLNNPVFGVGYAGYEYGVIGCHQEWFDMLGVFGVVGTVLFLLIMAVITVQTFRNAKTSVDKAAFLICLAMFVVQGFLNPCLNLPVLIAVFVIAPNVSALPMVSRQQMAQWANKWRKKK